MERGADLMRSALAVVVVAVVGTCGAYAASPGGTAKTVAPWVTLDVGGAGLFSGVSSPVFVTGAGDGSGRLFVVEQHGLIKVVDAAGKVTTFLDAKAVVGRAGGE